MGSLTQVPECPACQSSALLPLLQLSRTGVPHGNRGHNVTFSYEVMDVCHLCGAAVLEVFSHDCWSHDEDWDMYWWFSLAPEEVRQLRSLLASCPHPLDASCGCQVHVPLRKSRERIHGGIRHLTEASGPIQCAPLRVELREGAPRFVLG
jgi:hypothetical protein